MICKKTLAIVTGLVLFSASLKGAPPNFTLGFDGCPAGTVWGRAGEVKTFEIFSTLTTSENESPRGAQEWSISLEASGATLDTFEVKGLVVDAIFDEVIDVTLPVVHHEHYPIDLATCWVSIARLASHKDDPSRKGAISAIGLDPVNIDGAATLQPNGTERIARMVVSVPVPENDSVREVAIRYVDGFKSPLSQPVNNEIVLGGKILTPAVEECRFTVRNGDFSLALGFDGCPAKPVEGAPGELKTFEIFPALTTAGNMGTEGADSWAISLGIDGGAIKAIDVKGIQASTVFDDDDNPATPPRDPYYVDLKSAAQWDAELATSYVDPSRAGAISMVVLGREKKMCLQPNGTQRIARVLVEARIPEDGTTREVSLRFEDGFRSNGSPRQNHINIDDILASPSLGECRFSLRAGTPGRQVPGDSNLNGTLDLSDAVWIFSTLFLGVPTRFACGDGSPGEPGNLALLDWQPDGAIDISDGVAALQFLFLGGAAHHLAIPGEETSGCAPIYGCPESLNCR